jgi:hypothetical protein
MHKFTNYSLFITNYLLFILIRFQVIHVNIIPAKTKVYIVYSRKLQRLCLGDTE